MIKVIAVISKHSGCGQITVLVNLASGLVYKGYRVLIGDLGYSVTLNKWLGTSQNHKPPCISPDAVNNIKPKIQHSQLGIDLIHLLPGPEMISKLLVGLPAAEALDYDYLLLLPGHNEDCKRLTSISDTVVVCTDLSHVNELEELKDLDEYLYGSTGKANHNVLVLPNKIDTKEWEHNSRKLFALADYFGYEKIADPIPA